MLLFDPTNRDSAAYNPLLEVRRGEWEVRDVQNIADVLVDPEGALERRNHWEKTSHSLLVGAILLILSGFYITAGVAIRRRKKWGGIVGIAVAAVYAALAGLGMVASLASPAAAENGTTATQTLLTGLLGLGLSSAIIVLVIVRWRELE